MLDDFIRDGDLVFDVGANSGQVAHRLRSLGADVVCVEPQTHLVDRLTADGFQVVQAACGDRSDVVELHCSDNDKFASVRRAWVEGHAGLWKWGGVRTISVPMVTLDELIDEFGVPAFVKIDTEGHERSVLAGLSRPITAMSIEVCGGLHPLAAYHSGRQALEVAHALDAGYRFRFAEHSTRWMTDWVSVTEILTHLESADWGDVYVLCAE